MERIDFIDAYCDRWCERCPFTMRCAGFDRQVAIAMCDGDLEQAFELALSHPRPAPEENSTPPNWIAELLEQPTEKEVEDTRRQREARDRRVRDMDLSQCSHDYALASHRWLLAHDEQVRASADATVADTLDIVLWDSALIGAKLHRALSGREELRDGDDFDDSAIQNDWNGSAKVAIISLERSAAAWRVIAAAVSDPGATALAEHTARLLEAARSEFPRAMEFVRPGFDEPWR